MGDIVIDSLNVDAQPVGDAPGMWMSPDPLSEEFPDYSPYTFCFNNPISFVDPDGRAPDDWYETTNRQGEKTYKWFEGSGEQSGYKRIGSAGTITTSQGGNIIGSVSLYSDGSASASSTAGGSRVVQKETQTAVLTGLKAVNNFISMGAVSRMENALDVYDREGSQSYIYQSIADAHTDERNAMLSGSRNIGSSVAAKAGVTAYDTVLAGGKNSGFLKNYLGRNADEIGKSIKSMQSGNQGIGVHLDKIANPTKYVPNWNTLRPSHQQSLIKGWQNTVIRHTEQIQILQTIISK